ncbi:hypothetical protein TTHERM_001182051 (macronuclear) [Tetrahymena thermophila SB210]|uniref:Uncharacterized protein n=1 Tax=Tetrahymena thermophila (strain SB210) TaxID=312017 RepID=W7XFW3_TETTS|nr:hypothetical protein TTHERM_001182051 [Tetrahymena thermophila SB210]EWS72921.1 hypothetical protein TTHERM_001182051 [Tetrahymena thermophila SB210]|eukprot:XP_012654547.1 hypothetical protein TTHERM_001182051 [Tetrahymena thermophila SB210]
MQFAIPEPKPDAPQQPILLLSLKFERLMQFAKAEPKPDIAQSPIQLQLFKY